MSERRLHPLMSAAAVCVIAACVTAAAAVSGIIPGAASRKAPCADCGTVVAVRAVKAAGDASGAGAVAGGVTAAVIGSQFGHGDGRRALDALWRITVRMEDETQLVLSQAEPPALAVGDKVRIVEGRVVALRAAG